MDADLMEALDRYHAKAFILVEKVSRLEEENARLRAANRELAATCDHRGMVSTQEGPLDA